MRKLNIKMLTTVSAVAMSMAAASASAQDIQIRQWLDEDSYNAISEWNEQYVEAALGAAIVDATQIASIYLNEINRADIAAGSWVDIDQGYWVDQYDDGELRLDSDNGVYAITTMHDALIDGLTQVATTSFQTANLNITGEDDLTLVEISQYSAGEETYSYEDRDVEFTMISNNEALAIAGFMGTAVIDGAVFDEDLETEVNGVQQAINTLQSITVTADDDLDVAIGLSDGQRVDIAEVAENTDYWTNGYTNNWSDWTEFSIDATNDAYAYAPHGVSISDPAIRNLDQVAAANINSITVGTEGGNADFAIYAGEDDTGNYAYGQYADLEDDNRYNYWDNNYYGDNGYATNPVNVRNSAVATTFGEALYYTGGFDVAPGDLDSADEDYFMGVLATAFNTENWTNDLDNLGYDDNYGDVELSSLDQVASISVNSITNRGDGDLTLKGTYDYWVDSYNFFEEGSFGVEFTDDRNFEQTVYFEFDGEYANADSMYGEDWGVGEGPFYFFGDLGGEHPTGMINFALADTGTGDVTLDGVSQTASFSLNSIRSVGDLNGWTELDEGVYSEIRQYVDSDIDLNDNGYYFEGDAVAQAIIGDTDEGDLLAQDLSQTLAISANTISSNGNIRSDISQIIDEDFDLDIDVANLMMLQNNEGDITGGGLSQTTSISYNSIATRDLGDVEGGSLYTADIDQLGEDFDVDGDQYNHIMIGGMFGDGYGTDMASLTDLSQIYSVSLNSINVADDIVIGNEDGENFDGYEASIYQEAADNGFDAINELDVDAYDLVAIGHADIQSVQAAYISQNTITAGGDIIGGEYFASIYQDGEDLDSEEFDIYNDIDLQGYGTVTIQNYAQVAEYNVNTLSAGGNFSVDLDQESGDDSVEFDLINELAVNDDRNADYGSASEILQQATLNYATVDVTGNITGLIDQNSDQDDDHDFYLNNEIDVSGFVDASISGATQLAALNLNTVSAGGTMSANHIDQQGYDDSDYIIDNIAYATSFEGVSSIVDMVQSGSINLNTVSADLYVSSADHNLEINQYADIGYSDFQIENTIYAISDMGAANINGIVQQAVARVNSISSPVVTPIVD